MFKSNSPEKTTLANIAESDSVVASRIITVINSTNKVNKLTVITGPGSVATQELTAKTLTQQVQAERSMLAQAAMGGTEIAGA